MVTSIDLAAARKATEFLDHDSAQVRDFVRSALPAAYDLRGGRSMKFLREHGEFTDSPYELVIDGLPQASHALPGRGDPGRRIARHRGARRVAARERTA